MTELNDKDENLEGTIESYKDREYIGPPTLRDIIPV